MKSRFIVLIFLLMVYCCPAQSKRQLMNSIIKVNEVQSEEIGGAGSQSQQYLNFQRLKEKLSQKELIEMTSHSNAVLRTYAIMDVLENDTMDVVKLFLQESEKDEKVTTFEGCLIDFEETDKIIYFQYWNKVRIDAINKTLEEDKWDVQMQQSLQNDIKMASLDSIIIYSDKNYYWLMYDKVFTNRKYPESYLPRIEKMAFEKNNGFAMEYLMTNYLETYTTKKDEYLKEKFILAKIDDEKTAELFVPYVERILIDKNPNQIELLKKKIKANPKPFKESHFLNSILRQYDFNEY
jgi:hypothetical protein